MCPSSNVFADFDDDDVIRFMCPFISGPRRILKKIEKKRRKFHLK